jgi:hypothetical protein
MSLVDEVDNCYRRYWWCQELLSKEIAAAVRPAREKRDELQDVYPKLKSMMDKWRATAVLYDILPSEPPAAPEKTEAERAWDYLVLAAEASRYNT